MESRPVIEIQNLSFSYNHQPVLESVSFSIRENEFLAFIGPNGGGKTTLVKLIIGILKPDKGTISVFGKPPQSVIRRIGYVPQEIGFNNKFPVSVLDVVLMGRLTSGRGLPLRNRNDQKIAQEALEKMRMWEYRHQRIGELSGGQRQRTFIARALAVEPDILILDEPTASVDTKGQTELYHLLKELNETKTIIVVSHDVMILSSYVKSVACVSRSVYYHDCAELTCGMLEDAYHCPVELIAHGRIPHRVLEHHE